jgi:hypothetical protein
LRAFAAGMAAAVAGSLVQGAATYGAQSESAVSQTVPSTCGFFDNPCCAGNACYGLLKCMGGKCNGVCCAYGEFCENGRCVTLPYW